MKGKLESRNAKREAQKKAWPLRREYKRLHKEKKLNRKHG